jgi:hypothetical protein
MSPPLLLRAAALPPDEKYDTATRVDHDGSTGRLVTDETTGRAHRG